MTTLLERFIPEAREHLESAATGLLKLERNPSDEALVNEVFRAFHTLKGSSGLFDVPGLTRLVHAGEDLLDAARSNQLTLGPDMVDALLDALDRVSTWVDELERRGCLPDDAEGVSADLSQRLRALLPNAAEAMTPDAPVAAAQRADWLAELPEADRLIAFAETTAGGAPLLAISYVPDDGCFYRGEDPFNLFPQLAGLKALRVSFRDLPAPLAETDPFRSALAFRALTGQPRGEVEHLFRYVIEQVAIVPVRPEALILPVGDANSAPAHQDFVDDARLRLAARDFAGLRAAVATLLGPIAGQLWVASALRWLDAVLAAPLPNLAWAAAMVESIAEGRTRPIGDAVAQEVPAPTAEPVPGPTVETGPPGNPMAARILAEQMRIVRMPGDPDVLRRRMAAVESTVEHLLTSVGWSVRDGELAAATAEAAGGAPERLQELITALQHRVEVAVAGPAPVPTSAAALLATGAEQPAAGEAKQLAHVLKVDQAKVDALMNLIAELVVSKNSLPFLAKRAEQVYGSREMGREIKDQYAIIDRLAQEMQRAIMDVRMLPVSEVFERFPRLVRDLSRKLNKHIELEIVGEDTAADKTIIESLGDPLIHLVRNAIDHGAESPEQRLAAGKPEAALIQLKAFQEGDQVIIEVSDDGKGIDPSAIRMKAFEKGIITEDKADSLSDQDAVNLIFLPGFSTIEQVSDLSGRGVGMDVVRTAVEKIHGQVTLSARKGEGTLVRLSLPLSMAVARVMMVEVGESLFGVPMDGVAETVRVPRSRIRRIKRSQAFVLRDAIVPLVYLHALLELPHVEADVDEEAVLVARVGTASVGLVVDRLREGIDVILKPMEGVLAGMRGYSGSALLGDGRVLLVLNLKELL
jgi:two-component system, chemotaxis family, sensor kinase CheA